jgi:hypothetical protein
MIPVKDAVGAAIEYARSLLDLDTPILLEEVEFREEGGKPEWLITLSIRRNLFPRPNNIEYKTFRVDGQTGEVLSMKIRELAGAHD